jgi:hypothetical protein
MRRIAVLLAGVACSTALGACSSEGDRDRSPPGEGGPWFVDDPTLPAELPRRVRGATSAIRIAEEGDAAALEPLAITDLGSFFPESARLVGVALAPDTGQLYVLEARAGLYEITSDAARLVFDLPASRVVAGTGDGSPPIELTDVAVDPSSVGGPAGSPRFMLTAENDGFLLSLPSTTLTSHFCYFPSMVDDEPTPVAAPSISQELRAQGIPIVERTEAVAVNEQSGQIVAQPRTLRIDGAGVAGSELFVFDATGGQPTATRRFERTEFVAGGAAFVFQTSLVLGSGSTLYITQGWGDDVRRIASVPGASEITGMASLPGGNLLVLDGPSKRLLELDALAVGDAAPGL